MGRLKISLDRKELKKLYLTDKLSPYKIADKLGCSFSTVTNRLIEWKIPLRSGSAARMKYPKHDFNGSPSVAAYMLGFRQGDLNVYIPKGKSETVVVRCHTTDESQVQVMRELFAQYGQVTVSDRNNHKHVNCFLNNSFQFLIPKDEIPAWVRENDENAFGYIAGYIDAEGTFGLNQKRGRFKVDSYDLVVLQWIDSFLSGKTIRSKFHRVAVAGSKGWGVTPIFRKDLWRINVNEAQSLKKLILGIIPQVRHETRRRQMENCLLNIEQRISYGSVKN